MGEGWKDSTDEVVKEAMAQAEKILPSGASSLTQPPKKKMRMSGRQKLGWIEAAPDRAGEVRYC
jgi:hypothetical protein